MALVVFGVLSIFSAKYRPIAKEAFECVFRTVTFRPCQSGFDEKMKGEIVGRLMMHNEKAGGFVYKHFESLSLIFTFLFFASLIWTAYSIYNLLTLGTCEPGSTSCVLSPLVSGLRGNLTNTTTPCSPLNASHQTLISS